MHLFFRKIPTSRITGSYGINSSIFNFLSNLHTISYSSYTTSPTTMQEVSFSAHPQQHFLLPVFLIIHITTGVSWCLTVVLIFIPLILISDVEKADQVLRENFKDQSHWTWKCLRILRLWNWHGLQIKS